ncbi:MAG TPA: hypothetical protein VGS58_13515 [Candidatus Sulfopaludibacter sp.]|nr:hypothetical protein [Candidatus Sulfopaludibacter sp.]
MRRIHLAAGLGTVAVFLLTGQLMRHHHPPMTALGDAVRLMYRSRHIYTLAGGLVNLMLGLYMRQPATGWRGTVRAIGSVLLIASPVLLTPAFFVESAPPLPPPPPRHCPGARRCQSPLSASSPSQALHQ